MIDIASPALELTKLHKTFGAKVAVNALDLRVPAGSFFGLVGPNGAGKTTSLSMATGLLTPDSGQAHIFGKDVWQERSEAMELLGVLPDSLAMPERLTGKEALLYLGLLRGMDRSAVEERSNELLSVFGLAAEKTTLIKEYSTGMRKKIGLAMALLHNPRLLVLDEPLEAVDPVSALTIKRMLTQFVKHGGTVVFSSHVMALVEQLCDSVAIIHNGTVVETGALDSVRYGKSLEERFIELVGDTHAKPEDLSWLAS